MKMIRCVYIQVYRKVHLEGETTAVGLAGKTEARVGREEKGKPGTTAEWSKVGKLVGRRVREERSSSSMPSSSLSMS